MSDAGTSGDLGGHLGERAAAVLRDCANQRGWSVGVPARPWHAAGYTDARLATVVVTDGRGRRHLIVKYTPWPAGSDRLAAPDDDDPYARAAARCPPAFRRHLVLRADPPFVHEDGVLTFQGLAHDDVSSVRSLDDLAPDELAEAVRLVTVGVLGTWNGAVGGGEPVGVGDFLRRAVGPSLSHRGSVHRWAQGAGLLDDAAGWLDLGPHPRTGAPMLAPNPVLLALDRGPAAAGPVDLLTGRCHGDLHLRNVLVPRPGPLSRFLLIDLDGYRDDRSLALDPVTLLLSAVGHRLPDLPPDRWDDVLLSLADPDDIEDRPGVSGLVRAVYQSTVDEVRSWGSGWSAAWRQQFRLAVAALALMNSSFTVHGAKLRWWFVRLAAWAARSFVDGPPPPTGVPAVNPLVAPPPPSPGPSSPVSAAFAGAGLEAAPELDRRVARAWARGPYAERELWAAYESLAGEPPARLVGPLSALVGDCGLLLGREDPLTLELTYRLASALGRARRVDEAIALHTRVYRARLHVLGPDHPHTERSFKAAGDPWRYPPGPD